MRPPFCAICDRDALDEGGGLVDFTMTDADRLWAERCEREGFVGHPPWQEWFCPEHHKEALALSHLDRGSAMARLRD